MKLRPDRAFHRGYIDHARTDGPALATFAVPQRAASAFETRVHLRPESCAPEVPGICVRQVQQSTAREYSRELVENARGSLYFIFTVGSSGRD